MGMPVRIDDNLYELAKSEAKTEHRTIAGQIEFWATVGRAAIDNPDLPIAFITASLASLAEPREESTPFIPRSKKD
ncbi:ParD-like antitoxin of type II toxin-antitoxin system [Polynucleobacter meluiroseus]|uniref:ParD-like antitoxin of type II toxin-antitoxin system n=1 Tax=Polynucleobacter meluiroseus TaxID=1938814 RepID=A0A240E2D1_9BURK|nr:ParD-like family protein [Polynucleobacter meluiroseus]SNX29387.1 ParD-like antitoxin of type II toxin-antitoxin system [Polynucleobacter meluiroseus]